MAGQSGPAPSLDNSYCYLFVVINTRAEKQIAENKIATISVSIYTVYIVPSAIEPVKNYQTAGHRTWTNIYKTTALGQPQPGQKPRSNPLTKMHESIEIIQNYSEKSD